jgi:hypothetical protein
MEAEFIPYEQALALKELGFDEPCLGKFYFNQLEIGGNWRNNDFKEDPDVFISALLYQQAFRWLLILVNKDEHFSNKWIISYNEDYFSLFLGGCNMGVFKTELQCLKKLIEIVKEKK